MKKRKRFVFDLDSIVADDSIDERNIRSGNVSLYGQVVDFISNHKNDCIIVTGNLTCWTKSISEKMGCEFYALDCNVENTEVKKRFKILKKEGYTIVFVGDKKKDTQSMRLADVSIATGLSHEPSVSVLAVADYVVYTEEALCRILNQLC